MFLCYGPKLPYSECSISSSPLTAPWSFYVQPTCWSKLNTFYARGGFNDAAKSQHVRGVCDPSLHIYLTWDRNSQKSKKSSAHNQKNRQQRPQRERDRDRKREMRTFQSQSRSSASSSPSSVSSTASGTLTALLILTILVCTCKSFISLCMYVSIYLIVCLFFSNVSLEFWKTTTTEINQISNNILVWTITK